MKKHFNIIFVFILMILSVILTIYKDSIRDIFFKENISIEENKVEIIEKNTEEINENEEKDLYLEYKEISNFKLENLNRYIAYKEKNNNLSYEDIVTYVNIGLDYDFYNYISDSDTSLDNLILVNKYYKLSDNYEPNDLEEINSEYFIYGNSYVRKLKKEAKEAFEKLSKDSIENGTPVYGQSAYRPYEMQKNLYNNALSSGGQEYADSDTARPGHSEHQTGLAIDVSSTKSGNMLNFENTASFKWMENNAYKYGFILRYTKDKTNIHGYVYESWHYRYVGVAIATDMHDNYSNLTYEEYFDKFIDIKR